MLSQVDALHPTSICCLALTDCSFLAAAAAAVHLTQGLDIGPDSIKEFSDALKECKTVVWNGPMGVFEFDKFAKGTMVSLRLF